ncbi:hypothetical protein PACTADRAFT_48365 [Pachysolen tannophilus NRRL Y-2460]|uniref:Uncharacterized protein n=1 Tax=Pachysolen tannophilus NRRL Y-2460 TaxID=669874 RepID=A0A1E4TXR9_PACTA|nr:hypothetical protein PACTADRAFT_48365 [Pachysolen tannophilus NRRL Y-2460]
MKIKHNQIDQISGFFTAERYECRFYKINVKINYITYFDFFFLKKISLRALKWYF